MRFLVNFDGWKRTGEAKGARSNQGGVATNMSFANERSLGLALRLTRMHHTQSEFHYRVFYQLALDGIRRAGACRRAAFANSGTATRAGPTNSSRKKNL